MQVSNETATAGSPFRPAYFMDVARNFQHIYSLGISQHMTKGEKGDCYVSWFEGFDLAGSIPVATKSIQ